MAAILKGIRVIDWTTFQVGSVASAKLGDLGADVIKVEERGKGDALRGLYTINDVAMGLPGGRHANFEYFNRNKKGLALDLKKTKAREIIYRLVENTDVFVTNFPARAALGLGMDYKTLRKYNPRLIYASASGFGRKGPDSRIPAVDITGQARGGIMVGSGGPGRPPVMVSTGLADQVTAMTLAYGIIGALFARERQGVGQELHVSMIGSMIELQGLACAEQLLLGKYIAVQEQTRARNPLYNFYKCKDGKWIALALYQSDKHWPAFSKAVGIGELRDEPRFLNADRRAENHEQLISILANVFATKSYWHWHNKLSKIPDLPFSPVNDIPGLLEDPQVLANKYVVDFDHPTLGLIRFPGQSVEFSRTPGRLKVCAPECGQHTAEILLRMGYTWEDIGQLRKEEVV